MYRCKSSTAGTTTEQPASISDDLGWPPVSVPHAVAVEFDRYISAGDLQKAKDRIEKVQAEMEQKGGYVGMYL